MFPFPPNNHDIQDFGAPTPYNNPIIPDNLILDDLINEGFLGSGIGLIPTTMNQRERLISYGIQENEEKIKDDEVINVKKFVHTEVERQRRQEMGNLCGSLRTLLPLQYVQCLAFQGKRTMPDYLQGSVNYIKDMQSNIHQLKGRRDKLKKLTYAQIYGDTNLHNCVTVNPCPNGAEILINTIFEEEHGFSLSRILRELLERGFNVTSCFSTKGDERSLQSIQMEASDLMLEYLSGLQERLTYMINCPC